MDPAFNIHSMRDLHRYTYFVTSITVHEPRSSNKGNHFAGNEGGEGKFTLKVVFAKSNLVISGM